MNISPLTIYLWQLADTLHQSFSIIASVSAAMVCFFWFGMRFNRGNANTKKCELEGIDETFTSLKKRTVLEIEMRQGAAGKMRSHFLWWSLVLLISFFGRTLTPSSSTIAMMVVIPQIAESKMVQKDLPELYNAAVEALKNNLKKP